MLRRVTPFTLCASGFTACRWAGRVRHGATICSAVSDATAGKQKSACVTDVEEIPTLSFLSSKSILSETVDRTIEVCDALLNEIPKAKSIKEKHDLIDSTSNVLCLLLDPCEFVRQVHPDAEYKQHASFAFQKGYEYMSKVNSRRDLYDVVLQLDSTEGHKELSSEEIKNVAQLRRDMESNGIHLPDKLREKVTEMNIEKEELAMRFLTEQGSKNPFATLRYLLQCRYELSQLLGFESFAEQQLRGTMLENQQRVWHFLCGIAHKYRREAEKEMDIIRSNVGEVRNRQNITDDVRARVAHSLRRDAEPETAAEYFSVANCIRGIQCLCLEVFGVRLEEVQFDKDEIFNNDAKKYHVYDENKAFLGVIVLDLYASEMKYCQAGHLTLQLGCIPHQEALAKVGLKLPKRQYPVVVLTCNVGACSPVQRLPNGRFDDESTLMHPNEVTTVFHEFGHAMHTIFGQTKVQNLAGTRASIDFVETFSQLFEQFLTSHEFLQLWAHRISTREPISFDMVMKRNAAADMFKHLDMMDQVVLSAVDQTLHGPQPYTVYFPRGDQGNLGKRTLGDIGDYGRGTYNLAKVLIDICTPLSIVTPTETGVLGTLSFEHLSGYPAGYYGYLYSLSIARRIWAKKFMKDPLNRDAGRELVQKVMRHGAACNPVDVIENYLEDKLDEIDIWV
ncbi:metallo-peptidase, Clan MA(E) Family M3 [Trypanosoma brucei gambiense DAL972]|uniref:Mitochondrial intermediate peptidase, putative n=1 Tax=Trypanosoma brucei gambiense (strain MHOM/CI/86/DAL972) TaxID=679716 RepID=D0A4B0_TRYB9|nr:metallo-peptidase, Clan MA(E) Family M3 [Trypanosoma brucei gambiense DAL972]CBH16104.1 metallo-peptidase, Clan MA(E) Family M3 [Trypanosoma brucei gambiense DAL972]|eukprot:XP_011778368.1 metallo-peptidase, Clan MA(E) Family M3 [Trypanosoma brucei gambiense DAL972]